MCLTHIKCLINVGSYDTDFFILATSNSVTKATNGKLA